MNLLIFTEISLSVVRHLGRLTLPYCNSWLSLLHCVTASRNPSLSRVNSEKTEQLLILSECLLSLTPTIYMRGRTCGQYGLINYTTTEMIEIMYFQIIAVIAVINLGLMLCLK